MELNTLAITVGTAMNNKVKRDEDAVQENIEFAIAELLSRLQQETGGDAAQLRVKTQELRDRLEAGDALFAPQATTGGVALKSSPTSSASDQELLDLGTELVAIAGDVTTARASLDMHREVMASPKFHYFLTELLDSVNHAELDAALNERANIFFVIEVLKHFANDGWKVIPGSGGYELEALVNERQTSEEHLRRFMTLIKEIEGAIVGGTDYPQMLKDAKAKLAAIRTGSVNTGLADFVKLLAPALNMPTTTGTTIADQTNLVDAAKKAMTDSATLATQVTASKAIANKNGITRIAPDAGPLEIWIAIRSNQEHLTTHGVMGEKRPKIIV